MQPRSTNHAPPEARRDAKLAAAARRARIAKVRLYRGQRYASLAAPSAVIPVEADTYPNVNVLHDFKPSVCCSAPPRR